MIAGSGRCKRCGLRRRVSGDAGVRFSNHSPWCGKGEGEGFASRDRRLRSARNVDGPGLVEDDVAARVVVGERVGGRGNQLIRREALPVREPRDDALL